MLRRSFGVPALREYLLEGHPVSRLEALILFGVPDLTKVISDLRSEKYLVARGSLSLAAVLVRLRRHVAVETPSELPARDIIITEYRVST